MIILGISLGTKSSGIAILDNGNLAAWNTLSFKNEWSHRKANRIVSRYDAYLRKHKATVVVLKIPPLTHHTDAILSLIKRIQQMVVFHGCMVEYTTKNDIKQAIPGIRNTHDIMEYASNLYPVLHPAFEQEKLNRNRYHARMFEAVIVAHLWHKQRCEKGNTGP